MKINVGSTNLVKVQAVRDVMTRYDLTSVSEVTSRDVSSGVSEQPKSIGETVQGAKNRARLAFTECDLSFGIESGLIEVPGTQTGTMDCCVCAIFDGTKYAIGISSAFECPPLVTRFAKDEGLDLNQAFLKAGLTDDPKIGSSIGAVGLLTNGRVSRMEYTKQAITMAMIAIENPGLY